MAAPVETPRPAGGRWVLNPSDATDPSTGTELGLTHNVEFDPEHAWVPLLGSEFGNKPVDHVFMGFRCSLALTVVNWDQQIIGVLFSGVTAGGSGPIVPFTSSALRPGALASSRAVHLLHAAYHVSDPGIRVFAATPLNYEVIPFRHMKQALLRVEFDCLLDSSEQVAKLAALADM